MGRTQIPTNMASVKIWFRSDGSMMHPVAKKLFLDQLSALTAENLRLSERDVAVHTVETPDILVAGHAENCAHCIVEHLGSLSRGVKADFNDKLAALMKLHYHVEHYMVRFIAVADDEMILSAGLE